MSDLPPTKESGDTSVVGQLLEQIHELEAERDALREVAEAYFYSMTKENYSALGAMLRALERPE